MNPEVKTKWVEALRSGKYTQGRGKLHRTQQGEADSFCCLGVLCDLAVAEGVRVGVQRMEFPDSTDGMVKYGLQVSWLPEKVQEWAGLSSHNPLIGATSLAGHNDFGKSFAEIADMIEEHL